MKLRPHQQKFVEQNPDKALLNWEMRVGKSLPAAIWIDDPKQAGNTYIVTPKQNVKEWQGYGTKAKVLSKEQFKKEEIINPTAIVIDEAHYFASALFVRKGKGRSQLATKLYMLVKKYPNMKILLLTATPIRQDAWSLHTLLCYIGVYYDWKEWRERFFVREAMPFLPRPRWMKPWEQPMAWVPKDDWRIKIRPFLEKHADTVSLKDCVANLPEPKIEIVKLKLPKYEKPTDEIVNWMHEHQFEQQNKHKWIAELGFKKLIVVAHYTEQIDELAKVLSKEKPVYILDGRTKDAAKLKKEAQDAEECYFIVQSSMGFGFDGYMFGAIVFASMSHSCTHHTQMTGRPRHLDHLNPVNFYYLIGGRWDRRIYETIQAGRDFNPHIYLHE